MSPPSSTSPSDSIRFLPTSIDMIGAYSISRSLMRLPARVMISTRSRHGTAAQAGWAARAAATASATAAGAGPPRAAAGAPPVGECGGDVVAVGGGAYLNSPTPPPPLPVHVVAVVT